MRIRDKLDSKSHIGCVKLILKQESIPVGIVPPACQPYVGGGGVSVPSLAGDAILRGAVLNGVTIIREGGSSGSDIMEAPPHPP